MATEVPSYIPFKVIEQQMDSGTANELIRLDMKTNILWYQANISLILQMLDSRLFQAAPPVDSPTISNPEQILLTTETIGKLIGLFSDKARNRSSLDLIIGEETTWFHKDSIAGNLKETKVENERLSATALIPAKTSYKREENGSIRSDIHIYNIPQELVGDDPEIVRAILAEGVVHEYFHALTIGLRYSSDYLRLKDGRIIKGKDFVMTTFQSLAQNHGPISNYSSFYRNSDNQFKGDGDKGTSVSEELAEIGTTYLLGYGSGSLVDLGDDPLKDRAEIKYFLDDFIHSDLVSLDEGMQIQANVDPLGLSNEYKERASSY